jgi:hypothetical protein
LKRRFRNVDGWLDLKYKIKVSRKVKDIKSTNPEVKFAVGLFFYNSPILLLFSPLCLAPEVKEGTQYHGNGGTQFKYLHHGHAAAISKLL